MSLILRIISPERVEFDGQVECVSVPGLLGQFQILKNHAPIISALEKGNVVYVTTDGEHQLAVSGGFVSVKNNEVDVCVEVG